MIYRGFSLVIMIGEEFPYSTIVQNMFRRK